MDPVEDGDRAHYDNLYTGSQDNGGVHTNSGIPNHAFYRLVDVRGVRIQRAGDIFYLGFTGLTANADFCDARDATIAVAEGEATQVTAAWNDVGVDAALCDGVAVDNPPNAGFSVTCTNLTCTFAESSTDDGAIVSWSWAFGDGDTSTERNPPDHTYGTADTCSVSLTVTDDATTPTPQTNTAIRDVTVSDGSGGVTVVDGIDPILMLAAESPVTVMITGSGFGANVSVTFLNGSGPAPVASILSATDTTITATVSVK